MQSTIRDPLSDKRNVAGRGAVSIALHMNHQETVRGITGFDPIERRFFGARNIDQIVIAMRRIKVQVRRGMGSAMAA